ncbi:LysR family transcriptional regulator [Pseudomonas chlororaphis]|uniref:LysR family transcriptional regulator n=1 Tax=Pseudomonas chlororaphis TaxID=587753 RepID=UPI002365B3F9|nr:LysR family transcriptional regulator [Pseudomonas chlororaphis]WDH22966.1 LysR family transcriptional regulator [Pseudomonas chlororaphis]
MLRDEVPSVPRIDLNLLRVFDAVYEDRSILLASKRLHLSQSAVSHALTRLRESLQDELFIRTARGMQPSARAEAIAGPLREALLTIQRTVGVEAFDPSTATRTFTLAANDYLSAVLLVPLLRRLAQQAPGVELVLRPSTRLDLAEQIDVGRIDLALGLFAELPQRIHSTCLWQQQDVMLMCPGHPMLELPAVTLEALADYPLVTLSVGGQEEGAVNGYILERGIARQSEMFDRQRLEQALAAIGRRPDYKVTLPHSLVLPQMLEQSRWVAIVPAPLARAFEQRFALSQRALPLAVEPSPLLAIWHGRNSADPAHLWLRQQLLEVAATLAEQP